MWNRATYIGRTGFRGGLPKVSAYAFTLPTQQSLFVFLWHTPATWPSCLSWKQ